MKSIRILCYLSPRDYLEISVSEFRTTFINLECVNHDSFTTIALDRDGIDRLIELLTEAKAKVT